MTHPQRLSRLAVLGLLALLAACAPRPGGKPVLATVDTAQRAAGEQVFGEFLQICAARHRALFDSTVARLGYTPVPAAMVAQMTGRAPPAESAMVIRRDGTAIRIAVWNPGDVCEVAAPGVGPAAIDALFPRLMQHFGSQQGGLAREIPPNELPAIFHARPERPARGAVVATQVGHVVAGRLVVLSIGNTSAGMPFAVLTSMIARGTVTPPPGPAVTGGPLTRV